jgi:Tfp pilus assembly protein PilX
VNTQATQKGTTLIVTLIMMVVLTLLVISAIRFGNINLKIAGNMQSQSEAVAATQIAIERVMEQVKDAPNIDKIAASTTSTPAINTGGADYKVAWKAPACVSTRPVSNAELSTSKPADLPCFESSDSDKQVNASGSLTTSPSACNDQQWGVEASVDDPSSGTKVTTYQGFSVRVSAQVQCP